MDNNPKIFRCLNPRICAWPSCSLHGSLDKNLLTQTHQKPDRSLITGTTVLEKNLVSFKIFFLTNLLDYRL